MIYPIKCYYATSSNTGLIVGQKVWEFSDGKAYVAEDVYLAGEYKIVKGREIILDEHPELRMALHINWSDNV